MSSNNQLKASPAKSCLNPSSIRSASATSARVQTNATAALQYTYGAGLRLQGIRFILSTLLFTFSLLPKSEAETPRDEFVNLSKLLNEIELPQAQELSTAKQKRLQQWIKEDFPHIEADALIAFYQKNNPDALIAYVAQYEEKPKTADVYLQILVQHFQQLEIVKSENPREYLRLIAIEQYESLSRRLAKKIRALEATQAARTLTPAEQQELQQAILALQKILQKVFDAVQENQLIEINRLEAEMRELRQLLEERSTNRTEILRKRYQELIGRSSAAAAAADRK